MVYIIIGVIALTIVLFRINMSKKNNQLKSLGGIKEKYKEFISHFDDYDLNNKPTILNDRPNNYEIGWAGATTISKLWIYEMYDNLHIEFKLDYNKKNLERSGVNLGKLPQLNKKLTWKFKSNYNQAEMAWIVSQDIENLMDSM